MWIDDKETEQDPYNRGQNNSNANVGAGGGGAASVSNGSNTPQGNPSTISPSNTEKPTQNFATIQDYLGGNKQQGEDLGQKVTSSLSNTQNQEKGAIDTAAQGAKQDINSATIGFDSDLTSRAANNPTSVANNQPDLNSFLKQWNASYSGPSSFEASNEYGQAAKATNEASQKGQQLNTTGGREQLLQDQFGVYGQGNKGLDQAVLQNSTYFPKVQDQAKGFNSIQDYLGNKSAEINPMATQAQQTTQATKEATQAPFANALTNFQTDLNSRVASAQNTANKTVQQYQSDIASGNPATVDADLKSAGVSNADRSNIVSYLQGLNTNYGIKPNVQSSLIANPNVDINTANTATKADYDKAQALKTLTGVDYGGVLNPADAAKAETGKLGVKSGDLQSYLKQGLDTQDKSLLGTSPTLDWNAINAGKVSSEQATKSVQDAAAAGQRQGIPPDQNTTIKSLHDNAMQGLQAIYLGKENADTRPAAKVYADAAVAAMVAQGQTPAQAQQYINTWVKQLGAQVGNKNAPIVYK